VSIARAIELLRSDDNKFNKIIISTPIVEADEKLGFLPGDMRNGPLSIVVVRYIR
jgi:phosphate starvation-inducible protein PhoH